MSHASAHRRRGISERPGSERAQRYIARHEKDYSSSSSKPEKASFAPKGVYSQDTNHMTRHEDDASSSSSIAQEASFAPESHHSQYTNHTTAADKTLDVGSVIFSRREASPFTLKTEPRSSPSKDSKRPSQKLHQTLPRRVLNFLGSCKFLCAIGIIISGVVTCLAVGFTFRSREFKPYLDTTHFHDASLRIESVRYALTRTQNLRLDSNWSLLIDTGQLDNSIGDMEDSLQQCQSSQSLLQNVVVEILLPQITLMGRSELSATQLALLSTCLRQAAARVEDSVAHFTIFIQHDRHVSRGLSDLKSRLEEASKRITDDLINGNIHKGLTSLPSHVSHAYELQELKKAVNNATSGIAATILNFRQSTALIHYQTKLQRFADSLEEARIVVGSSPAQNTGLDDIHVRRNAVLRSFQSLIPDRLLSQEFDALYGAVVVV